MRRRNLIKELPFLLYGVASPTAIFDLLDRATQTAWHPSGEAEREIEALAEAILPATDTPGAIGAGVPAFISLALNELVPAFRKDAFYHNLALFSEHCFNTHGSYFHQLDTETKVIILSERFASKDSFIREMKRWTLFGYFNSETGTTVAQFYDPNPGQYQPCIQVEEETRANASYF